MMMNRATAQQLISTITLIFGRTAQVRWLMMKLRRNMSWREKQKNDRVIFTHQGPP